MPVNVREVKQALLIAATTGSPEQQAAAKEALAKIDGAPAPVPVPEITGPVVLGKIKVSAEYAKSLQKTHGSLGDEAIKEAAGKRLCDAASMSDKAEFLKTFPEDEAFYDAAVEQVTALYTSMDAGIAKIREAKEANRPPVVEVVKPEPAQPAPEYTPMQPMTAVERALALKRIMRSGSEVV